MPLTPAARRFGRIALLAVAYATLGLLAVALAVPPGFAAPIYPSAGVALAATLVFGPSMAIGAFAGAFAVNLVLTLQHGGTLQSVPWLALAVGFGAAAQALAGAALVRRRSRQPLLLSEPREVLSFFLFGGVLACGVSAAIGTSTMVALGLITRADIAFNAWSWWSGDVLGVLVAAPVTLTLIGRPRADWATRRTSVALPLVGAMALLTAVSMLVARWDVQRLRSVFERDAHAAAEALGDRLHRALFALEALRGLSVVDRSPRAAELRRAAAPWLDEARQIQALGYAERVPRGGGAAFADEVRRLDGPADFRVFDRQGPGRAQANLAADADLLTIRFVEPMRGNAAALGVNILSVAAARETVQRAILADAALATPGFRLTQETSEQTGVVVYRPLYRGDAPQKRPAEDWTGAVFVTLRMQQTADAAMAESAGYLRWCLTDLDTTSPRPLLAASGGAAACPSATDGALALQRAVDFAGRRWRLTMVADRGTMPEAGYGNAWLFSAIGLVSSAVLSALLLTVTGRARRIEAAVTERTADLQREVAERQRTEAALRASEQRFRNVFDQAPLGIAYADLRGHVSESNPRLRAMLGHDAESLAQQPLTALAPPEDQAAEAAALAALLRDDGQPAVSRRLKLRHADGQWLSVQMNWSLLRDAQGRPHRLVAVVEDITDQLRREEAEQGRQVAESANRAKNEFLSRMSHELRTPLNAMLGFAQLLELDRKPPLAPRQAGWNSHILQAGWHLLEMINDILDLSRIEAGMLRLHRTPVPLAPLLQQCLAMVATAAGQRGIRTTLQIAPDAAVALGDATRIKQVLTNLLSNAVKYNVEGGEVHIDTQRLADGRLQIGVGDSGPGFDEAQRAQLFQPFNRLGREQQAVEGTGIGLVISRRLAEWMGGSLELDAAPAQPPGARFLLTLPAADPADAVLAAPAGPADDALPYRQRRVLYIEDNETNAEVMRGVLAQRPQVRLTVAGTGQSGLDELRRERPDLVLLDMHLPDADGLDLLRMLRGDPGLHGLPVVVVSADATPSRIEAAQAAGALHYLTKPLDVAAFLAVLDQVLDSVDTGFGGLDGALR